MFKATAKQLEQLKLLNDPVITNQLHYGGSRSGKTINICRWLHWQCYQYVDMEGNGVPLAILRSTQSDVRARIFNETYKKMLRMEGWELVKSLRGRKFHEKVYTTNVTELTISYPTGSVVSMSGVEDKERLDKILGAEFGHIYFNEASLIPFEAFDLVNTRASLKCQHVKYGTELVNKVILDCNPPSKAHWLYDTFFEGKHHTLQVAIEGFPQLYGTIQMNPDDNWENLSSAYKTRLSGYVGKARERFLLGEFQDNAEYALWPQHVIDANRIHPDMMPTLERVVVAIDPAVTANESSDKTGIIVAGKTLIDGEYHFFILNDSSMHGLPSQWANRAMQLYEHYRADAIIAETNQGGQTIIDTIRHAANERGISCPHIYTVHAKRGKYLRAEPISYLYAQNKVHHTFIFPELEKQMTSFTGESKADSPNNLDALVYAIVGAEHSSDWSTIDYTLKG